MDELARLQQHLQTLAGFTSALSQAEGGHRLSVDHDAKSVVVVWPHGLSEVYFEFLEGGRVLLAESVEYYDEEPIAAQAQDVARVVRDFLQNQTRVVTVGTLLRRKEIQYRRGENWSSII